MFNRSDIDDTLHKNGILMCKCMNSGSHKNIIKILY